MKYHSIIDRVRDCNNGYLEAVAYLEESHKEMLGVLKRLRKDDFADIDEPFWKEVQDAIYRGEESSFKE